MTGGLIDDLIRDALERARIQMAGIAAGITAAGGLGLFSLLKLFGASLMLGSVGGSGSLGTPPVITFPKTDGTQGVTWGALPQITPTQAYESFGGTAYTYNVPTGDTWTWSQGGNSVMLLSYPLGGGLPFLTYGTSTRPRSGETAGGGFQDDWIQGQTRTFEANSQLEAQISNTGTAPAAVIGTEYAASFEICPGGVCSPVQASAQHGTIDMVALRGIAGAATTNVSGLVWPTNAPTVSLFKCRVDESVVGSGAGTCTYALLDGAASCTGSFACNAAAGSTVTTTCTGANAVTIAPGDAITFSVGVPAANTSSAAVTLNCTY